MPTWLPRPKWGFGRQASEAIVLAIVSLFAVACLRFPGEPRWNFVGEMSLIAVCFAASILRPADRRLFAVVVTAVPVVFAMFNRLVGSPLAPEMTMLTTLGAASLAMATGSDRTRAMSLVASGFLTLFAVSISDHRYAVGVAVVWMAVCVWHLVANHWERLELCAVQDIRRGSGVRPVTVIAAVVLCILGGWAVRDRFAESRRFQFGFMPTSGGSQWSDPAARGGVGTGDAAIAAKDHAESFGAVESELFLESTESSLYDMFNDMIGEPKTKPKYERRQALASENVQESHEKNAKSEKGGGEFSTDRMPPKKHQHLTDADENAIVQWSGPTGIRLGMNRYDTFDGVSWTNQATSSIRTLARKKISDAVWFFNPRMTLVPEATDVNLLKVLRLDSTHLPTPMMTVGLHIKDIDGPDFFGIDDDESYFMPGRERVPPLTVVNVASMNLMQDELLGELASSPTPNATPGTLGQTAARLTAGFDHPYEKLRAIVSHLRDEFVLDRDAATKTHDPVAEFLQTGRGGDHLFATTAALLAREIGLQSRLVTGFYVRSTATDIAAGHANVLPTDVHVWAEIRLDDGRWFEIEPTPGYREPVYTPSLWLTAKTFAAAYWPHAAGLALITGVLGWTRLFWIDLALRLLYPIAATLWPRRRLTLAMRVIQTRATLAGCPRIPGRPQRDWLLSLTSTQDQLRDSARRFCDAADRAAFAVGDPLNDRSTSKTLSKDLLMQLNVRTLRQLATRGST